MKERGRREKGEEELKAKCKKKNCGNGGKTNRGGG